MARSRSSWITSLLHKRGLWTPPHRKGDQWNRSGYWEHQALKKLINTNRKPLYSCLQPCPPIEGFKERWEAAMHTLGWKGQDWMVKVDVFAYTPFEVWDPLFVKIWRPKDMILDSINRTPFMYKRKFDWPTIIDKHHELMGQIEGPDIHSERVLDGDETELDKVIEIVNERNS